jgi:purine-nucleoside phosphorylase
METPDIEKATAEILSHIHGSACPRILLVLGSGWGSLVDTLMEVEGKLLYEDIPGFPVSTVEGHQGCLLWGRMAGVPIWVMQGRFHYYEGYSLQEVTFPIRVFSRMGLRGLLLTNAAGGIDQGYKPGQLMVIEDHINFMGDHPLRGPNLNEFGPRFPDMTEAWDGRLRDCFIEAASQASLPLHIGVYLAVSGPSFETPAEIRAFSRLGANAVGMSTVPECIVARHAGLRVAGISCITNLAAHLGGSPLTHEEVGEAAREAEDTVVKLFRAALPAIELELGGKPDVA